MALGGPAGSSLGGGRPGAPATARRGDPARAGTDAFADFWRRVLPVRLPARLRSAIIEAAMPELPEQPTARQALAYAELYALAGDRALAAEVRATEPACYNATLLYQGLGEAYPLAAAELADGAAPGPGATLDSFVAAHASAARKVDSADFRRTLSACMAGPQPPATTRYWALAGELHPTPTMGAAHEWLVTALAG